MKKNSGTIVCISSICGVENLGAPVGYQVAKAALNMYVKSIAKQLALSNIRINAIAPGNLMFEGSTWELKVKENRKNILDIISREVALKRFGKPKDISNFVVFLSSKFSSFATGEIFVIDGGQVRSL